MRLLRRLVRAWDSELSGQSSPASQDRETSASCRRARRASSQCPFRERRRGSGSPRSRTSSGPKRRRLNGGGALSVTVVPAALCGLLVLALGPFADARGVSSPSVEAVETGFWLRRGAVPRASSRALCARQLAGPFAASATAWVPGCAAKTRLLRARRR